MPRNPAALDNYSGMRPLSEVLEQKRVTVVYRERSLAEPEPEPEPLEPPSPLFVYAVDCHDGKVGEITRHEIVRWSARCFYIAHRWGTWRVGGMGMSMRDGRSAIEKLAQDGRVLLGMAGLHGTWYCQTREIAEQSARDHREAWRRTDEGRRAAAARASERDSARNAIGGTS